jgi:hypothetical protein
MFGHRDVPGHGQRPPTTLAHGTRRLFGRRRIEVVDRHVDAGVREGQRRRSADALTGPGDQCGALAHTAGSSATAVA